MLTAPKMEVLQESTLKQTNNNTKQPFASVMMWIKLKVPAYIKGCGSLLEVLAVLTFFLLTGRSESTCARGLQ